ncbi:hypothetical protein [Paenibacillus sp. NEAU-GSW1]|uniref:hypothetical protein n=1 Tax=Paenibacillus sp. NEAU-GSW1 TaxID=2682486 RepID=UPI0012E16C10|nr:hypothetical protein [Paenibacillus sp. NEAU-GSW1]MUT65313.1 hypothetical protein [Paenibacillus sp. NEAU-GSW1]
MPKAKKADIQPLPEKVETTTEAQETKEQETRYSADSLRRNARHLFHVNPEVVDGALYGADGEAFTITEVKTLITAYLQREVR